MNKTNIEWADYTWNPITGCTKISEGCANCYAHAVNRRFGKEKDFKVTVHEDRLREPTRLKKGAKIFVCSMSDLFHDDVPDAIIQYLIGVFIDCPQHIFQILTKRPARMRSFMERYGGSLGSNVWHGVTAENQERWDERVFDGCFVSVEPMLGPVHLHGKKPMWVICGPETGPEARAFDPEWARSLRNECLDAIIPFFYKKNQPECLARYKMWPKEMR